MASTPIQKDGLRQRNVAGSKKSTSGSTYDDEFDKLVKPRPSAGNDIEYKIGLFLITALAFVTRFWGISHPDEVVFDEVHFGKVRHIYNRRM